MYQIKIINDTNNDEYNDELQILDELGHIIKYYKGYKFISYENVDNYLILDIDEGYKFSDVFMFINLDTFEKYHQTLYDNNKIYRIKFDKNDKKIIFNDEKYEIKYFFENKSKIIEDYEIKIHTFDTTKDTLLKSIFTRFNKSVDNNSQIKIDGFTFGMSNCQIDIFKSIIRDNTITLERQLMETLFGHGRKLYDLCLTIHYKDNNIDEHFSIKIECKNKIDSYYGEYDPDAKLQIIT